jgi:acetyltransferase
MAAYQAAFLQSGVIEAATVSELFDIALALDSQPVPAGKRVAILTNSGGPAALASDSLSANGLELCSLGSQTQSILRGRLAPSAQVSNPVDMLGGAEPADYGMALAEILKDPEVDSVIPILVPQALIKPVEVADALIRASAGSPKPVVACFMGDEAVVGARNALHDKHIPMYSFPETPGKALAAMIQFGEWQMKVDASITRLSALRPAQASRILCAPHKEPSLGENEMRPVLQAYGIPLVAGFRAGSVAEAVEAAVKIGGTVVMKIVSPDLLHKSDAGGIRLGLCGEEAVRAAYAEMISGIRAGHPEARLEGVMIEAMAPMGTEVIVGMRRDPSFGPLLMFGLGGIYVELFTDVAFRIAPVSREEAYEMIRATRAGKLLSGFRGQPPADLGAVVDCIQRLGEIALDFPEIEEAEINPLLVYPEGQGALALDCRAILGGKR